MAKASPQPVEAGDRVMSVSSRRSVAEVTSATAFSKASSFARDGLRYPLTFRTYCRAAA